MSTGKLATGKLSTHKLVNGKLSIGKIVNWKNCQLANWQLGNCQLAKLSISTLSTGKLSAGKKVNGQNGQVTKWSTGKLSHDIYVNWQSVGKVKHGNLTLPSAAGKVPNIVFLGEQFSALLSALGSLFSLILVIIFVPEINKQTKPKESNLIDLKKVVFPCSGIFLRSEK